MKSVRYPLLRRQIAALALRCVNKQKVMVTLEFPASLEKRLKKELGNQYATAGRGHGRAFGMGINFWDRKDMAITANDGTKFFAVLR